MTPVVQFDPASLSIWTCTGSLGNPEDALAHAAMRAAAQGDDPLAEFDTLDDDTPLRRHLLWLASCVWHEKRHFFDTLLTNYGALRFRNLLTLGLNLQIAIPELAKRGDPIWFPIELYDNKVRRRVLGIADPLPDLQRIARHARHMKDYVAQIDAAASDGMRAIHVGAEAQLEGLAQVSQMHAIEWRYGVEGVRAITLDKIKKLPAEGPYRAIESVSGALGCSHELSNGDIVVNPALAAALYVTALCTRQLGAGIKPDRSLVSPWDRVARLIEELGPKPGRFHMSDEEAMALADKAALNLWGRSAVDEIEADIDLAQEKFSASIAWAGESSAGKVFAEYSALRRRALARVRELGSASLLPRAFPQLWLDALRPWHVVATPDGAHADAGGEMVQGIRLNLPPEAKGVFAESITWASAFRPEPSDDAAFALHDRAWFEMLERYGPLAQLGLAGRRGRLMVPPALTRQIDAIEGLGVPVKFDPMFEWPEARDITTCGEEALALAQFSGRETFICDVTGDQIAAHEAAVLTPWEMRHSPLVERVRDGSFAAELLLLTNWSDWVVRRDLLA